MCRKSVRDEQLKPKLCTEVRGIFHWMLRGVADYRLNGMQYPEKVEVATSQYRESQDVIAQFIAAKCVLDVNAEVRFAELYSAYKYWADASREYMMPARKFSDALKKREGVQARGKMDGTVENGNCSPRISSAISRRPSLSRPLKQLDLALGCGRRDAPALR